MHDVDKDKFQFRFGKQTTVDFLDLYNGRHINTCQTPTPLNWYNYHLYVCFNGRLNLSVRFMKSLLTSRWIYPINFALNYLVISSETIYVLWILHIEVKMKNVYI